MRWHGLLAGIVLIAGCGTGEPDYAVGTLERYRIDVTADSSEPIVGWHVVEGERVSPGQLLVEQDASRFEAAMARAEAEAERARARLDEARAGPRVQEIQRVRAELDATEALLATVRAELARQQSLLARNFGSESQVNLLKGQVEEIRGRAGALRAQLDELKEGTRLEQLEQARAAYEAARAHVAELKVSLDRTRLVAPVSGRVERILFRRGERPPPGASLTVILSDERLFARVHIPQPLRTQLKPGDEALVRIDGHPDDYRGRIRWISAEAAFTPFFALTQHDRSRLAYLAEIDLLDAQDLPNGVPVEVRFPGATASR